MHLKLCNVINALFNVDDDDDDDKLVLFKSFDEYNEI